MNASFTDDGFVMGKKNDPPETLEHVCWLISRHGVYFETARSIPRLRFVALVRCCARIVRYGESKKSEGIWTSKSIDFSGRCDQQSENEQRREREESVERFNETNRERSTGLSFSLSLSRIDQHHLFVSQEFDLLNYSLRSARIFFRADKTAEEDKRMFFTAKQ